MEHASIMNKKRRVSDQLLVLYALRDLFITI